jgi:hypothetical protein
VTGAYRSTGFSALGIWEKSGHSFQLKRCRRRISSVSSVACSVTGLSRIQPTVSTRKGIEVTWSMCECVTKI